MEIRKSAKSVFAVLVVGCAGLLTSSVTKAADTVTATISVGSSPWTVAINPAGTFAYVVNGGGQSVSKINLITDTVVATITVGVPLMAVAINPAGTFAYVANYASNSISKINLSTDTVAASISVGSNPRSVAINPAGTFAYVVNTFSSSVSKINLTATEPQSITFASIATTLSGVNTVSLGATANSALPVSFSSATMSVCTVSGTTVTLVGYGVCTIHANQSGGSGWDAASQVSRTFTVARQVITFGSLSDVLLSSGTRTVSATASSGLVVSFSSSTSDVCTV